MVKIRLHGTRDEIETAATFIWSQFNVLSESEPYADRGKSVYCRMYMDCEVKDLNPVNGIEQKERYNGKV